MNSSGQPKARRRRPAVRTALPNAGVLVLLITSAGCPALGAATEEPGPTGEIEFRDILTLAYGSELDQIGYREETEEPFEADTVRAWCVSPRRTIWLVDEVSGLAKEFSLEGELIRSLPVLAQAWKQALAKDESLRERLVRTGGSVPLELTMPSASSMAEDASGRLFVMWPPGMAAVLDATGQPIVDRYDDQGELVERSGWSAIRGAIRRRTTELGWERQPILHDVQADTEGNVHAMVSGAPGREEEFSYFRLREDLSLGEFVPAEAIGDGNMAFRWRYPTPVVDLLPDGQHVDRAITLALPDQMLGKPSSAWPIPRARYWAAADRQGRICVAAGGVPKAFIVFDAATGTAITWAKIPEDERASTFPLPSLDPEGGVFVLCFKNDGLHLFHLDL